MAHTDSILRELMSFCEENGLQKLRAPLNPNLDLFEIGALDSMGLVTLQAWIEGRWGITIPVEVFLMELRTLSDICIYLQRERVG